MFKIYSIVLIIFNLVLYLIASFYMWEFPLDCGNWSSDGRLVLVCLIMLSFPMSLVILETIKELKKSKSLGVRDE